MLGNLFGKQKAAQPPTDEMEAFYLQQFMDSNNSKPSTPRPMNSQNPFTQMSPQPTYQNMPPSQGMPPQSFGAPPQPFGAPPQGMSPQSFGAPPQGMSPQSFGAPPQGMSPQPFGAPPQGMQPQSFGMPPQGMQPQSFGMPPQGMQPQSFGAPPQGMPSQSFGAPPQGMQPQFAAGPSSGAIPFMTPKSNTPSSSTAYPDMPSPYVPQLLPTDFSGMSIAPQQQSFEPSLSGDLTPSSGSTFSPTSAQPTFVERQLEQHELRLEHLHDRLKTIETYLNLVPPK